MKGSDLQTSYEKLLTESPVFTTDGQARSRREEIVKFIDLA